MASFIPTAVRRSSAARISQPATATKIIAAVLVAYAVVSVDRFGTLQNIRALFISVSIVGIAAIGSAFVTVSGFYFLLSVGATAGVSALTFAVLLEHGVGVALVGATALGALAGAVQGYAIGFRRTDPIVTTIAASTVIIGLGQLASGGRVIANRGDASWLAVHSIGGVLPVSVLFLVVLAVMAHLLMSRTSFGRSVQLTGSNRKAAELAGIPTRSVVLRCYALAGSAAGLAGAFLAARAGQGSLQAGSQLDFDVITAIVVGGIAVAGGRGRVLDAVFGAVFIGLINNILLLQGYGLDIRLLSQGAVLLIAVVAAAALTRRNR